MAQHFHKTVVKLGNDPNARIAAELVLTHKTVRNYVSSILNKLQATNRFEAGERARQAGIEKKPSNKWVIFPD